MTLAIKPPYKPMEGLIMVGKAMEVSGLIAPEMLVEIEADAYILESSDGD